MQAGETLCSLKSRNNCIMRRKIFDIYKALRHFNVTAEEMQDITKGYRYWIKNPLESRPPFNTVYFIDGKLYSMPYPSDKLSKRSIGIEIDGVVYFTHYCYREDVLKCQLEMDITKLKACIAERFAITNQFNLRMPTRDEAKTLVRETYHEESLNFVLGNNIGDVWITPNPDHPEKTVATVSMNSAKLRRPGEFDSAMLYFVICPDDDQIFFGEIDKYGVPTPETQEVYTRLQNM